MLASVLFWSGTVRQEGHIILDYQIAKTAFFCFTFIIWCHFLLLVFMCFRAAFKTRMTAIGVAELVASTVFLFAAAHYYVALLSDEVSYYGALRPTPEGDDFDDRIFFFPAWETIVDFIYFSVVTTATVGYGDIYPKTLLARLVTTVQIGMSFVLIAVVLALVIGRPPRSGSNKPDSEC